MTRYVVLEIEDHDSWYLCQTVFNELFESTMINVIDKNIDSSGNYIGRIGLFGITDLGLKILNEHGVDFAKHAKKYREGEKK